MRVVGLLVFLAAAAAQDEDVVVREDFSRTTIHDALRFDSKSWRVAGGELRGKGGGHLEFAPALSGNLTLSFEAWTKEKANIEVWLVDAGGRTVFTYAFLGQYHSVLKGVKACMLKGNRFVSVKADMWIFPGRRFRFEVKKSGNQYLMFLDGELGPVFVDPAPQRNESFRVRILVNPVSSDGEILVDNVSLRASKAGAPGKPAPPPSPPKPPGAERVLEEARTRNITLKNHADASYETATIARDLQQMYDFLKKYVGAAPERVVVHIGKNYQHGFARPGRPHPEMFLRAAQIFDTSADYAHEMMHCFMFRYGLMPHWFNESLSDMAYIDSEIELYRRRKEGPFLGGFGRIDHRSFELAQLRMRYGKEYYRKVCRLLEKNGERCRATFRPAVELEKKNLLILELLSAAAGTDLKPLFFKEFGFKPKTRERQRGY